MVKSIKIMEPENMHTNFPLNKEDIKIYPENNEYVIYHECNALVMNGIYLFVYHESFLAQGRLAVISDNFIVILM